MSYLDLAEGLVKTLEGCRLVGYLDTGGKPTIGYGHTGPEVRAGETVSQEIADRYLLTDLAIADQRLKGVCKLEALTALQEHQHAALVSFVFNVGADASWTVWRDVNAGNLADVPAQLHRFIYEHKDGKLQVVPGLEHRREAEIVYWQTADLNVASAVTKTANAVQAPPSSYTVAAITPPAPLPPPPLAKTSIVTKVVTACAGACAAAGTMGNQVHAIVAPHADEAPIFGTLAVAASGVVIAAAVVGLMVHAHQTQARAS